MPTPLPKVDYDVEFARQDGRCALCGKRSPRRRLDRDHDHLTGRFRGLLCRRCNRALAPFEWSDEAMTKLVTYLKAILKDHKDFEERQ